MDGTDGRPHGGVEPKRGRQRNCFALVAALMKPQQPRWGESLFAASPSTDASGTFACPVSRGHAATNITAQRAANGPPVGIGVDLAQQLGVPLKSLLVGCSSPDSRSGVR